MIEADALTEPQRRHMIELVSANGETRYWRPANSGERRCAETLLRKGLLTGSFITSSDAYYLSPTGLALARGMKREAEA